MSDDFDNDEGSEDVWDFAWSDTHPIRVPGAMAGPKYRDPRERLSLMQRIVGVLILGVMLYVVTLIFSIEITKEMLAIAGVIGLLTIIFGQ